MGKNILSGSIQWILVFWVVAITCGQQYYYYGDEGPYAATNLDVPIQSSYDQTKGSWARNDDEDLEDDDDDDDDDEDEDQDDQDNQMRRSGSEAKVPLANAEPYNFPIKPGTHYKIGEKLKADPAYLYNKNARQGRFLWPFSVTVNKEKKHGTHSHTFASEYPLFDDIHNHDSSVDIWDTSAYKGYIPPNPLPLPLYEEKKKAKYDLYSGKKFEGLTKEDYWYLHSRGYRKYRRKKRKKIKKLKKKLKMKRVMEKIIQKKIEKYEAWAPEEPW